jgi:aromatase
MSGHTENRVLIKAPLEQVWTVTNDVPRWTWLFTEYAEAEVLETADNYVKFRLTTHPENAQTWTWVSERRLDPANHVVEARRVETGPFEYMNIRWEYRETDDGVEMRWMQDFQMRTTAPVDDAGMTERINTNTPIQMARIKELIESGATARLADVP